MQDLLAAISPKIADLPESGIVEVVNHARLRGDLVPLWIGEGDLPTPEFISEAAVAALHKGETFYTWQRGIPPLREGIARYLTNTYGAPMDPERIFVTVGGMQAIMQTVQLLLEPGDEVLTPSPVWPNIFNAMHIVGAVAAPVPLTFGNRGWSLDLDRLFDAVTPRTKAIFVNSPGNPTGWMMTREEQQAVLEFARARGLWIISDEVYGRMTYEVDHAPSFLEITEPDDRVIVCNTFSKNWSMTGWRIGWIVAPAALGQVYENLIQYNTSGVPTFLQFGAVAAINDGEPYVKKLVDRCTVGRDLVTKTFDALPRIRYAPPAGAFYAFFAVEGEDDSRELAFKIVDQVGVGLAPGSAFGQGGDPYLRLCFGCSHDLLQKGLDRLADMFG